MEGTKIEDTGAAGCGCPWSSESASMKLPEETAKWYKEQLVIRWYGDIARKFGLDNTPLVDLSYLSHKPQIKIFAKDESQNVTGSVKIRAALFNLVKSLEFKLVKSFDDTKSILDYIDSIGSNEKKHSLDAFLEASSGNYASNGKRHFLDASSGNYAKALAYLAAQLGYDSTLFVPENVSAELQKYISAQGLNTNL